MRVYELTLAKEVDGKMKSDVVELRFPSGPDEITMRQWTDFMLRKAECPEFMLRLDTLDPSGKEVAMTAWGQLDWAEFFANCADLLATVVNQDSATLLKSMPPLEDGQTSLLALYIELASCIEGYVPKQRKGFTHKGHDYVWPDTVVDNFGRSWAGQGLSTAEAIEALQTEHVYNAKDEQGVYVLADRKYHVDVTLTALLSRREKNGKVEALPLKANERRAWIERRVKEFDDLPMSVALDMAFFLTSSKIASVVTRLYSTRLTPTPPTSTRPRPLRMHTSSGVSGAGT